MIRTHHIYITAQTARDCKTAATLLGASSPDEWAEGVLRKALDAIPALVAYREKISSAIASVKRQWEQEHNL